MDNTLTKFQMSIDFIGNNYDYCWFKSRFTKVKKCRDCSIVTGSSHALNAIDAYAWEKNKIVNCSMHSQDLYYDFVSARECAKLNSKVKNCYIIMGYYIAFADLRKSEWGRFLIKNIWYPILHDIRSMHEITFKYMDELKQYNAEISDSSIDDVRDISVYALSKEDNYYNSINIRRTGKLGADGRIWKDLTEEEKDYYAKVRAAEHNKMEKYISSYEENIMIFNDYISFLVTEDIKPIIVITPFTKEYNKYVSESSKEACRDLICQAPYKIECIDFNNYLSIFTDEDYMDSDHMSEIGANKFSKMLYEKLE